MPMFTVLGAAGFIGTHLVNYLRRSGHEVWAPERADPAVYNKSLGHVIYCIGLTTDYWQRPLDTAEAHVCVLLPILRRAQFERLVYLSSLRLYDGLEGHVDERSELILDPLNPRHIYDLSKSLGEALVHRAGRPATVARLGSVYDDKLDQDDFLCRTIRKALPGGSLNLDTGPNGGRDYIHVDDVCTSLEAIALRSREPIYNVASGSVFTNRELAVQCEREFGCRVVFDSNDGSRRPPAIAVARLERDFGIHPAAVAQRLPSIMRDLKGAGGKT